MIFLKRVSNLPIFNLDLNLRVSTLFKEHGSLCAKRKCLLMVAVSLLGPTEKLSNKLNRCSRDLVQRI